MMLLATVPKAQDINQKCYFPPVVRTHDPGVLLIHLTYRHAAPKPYPTVKEEQGAPALGDIPPPGTTRCFKLTALWVKVMLLSRRTPFQYVIIVKSNASSLPTQSKTHPSTHESKTSLMTGTGRFSNASHKNPRVSDMQLEAENPPVSCHTG